MGSTQSISNLGRPVAYYPSVAAALGGVAPALLVCQLLYWQGVGAAGRDGIYKTSDELEAETGLGYREQATARRKLKALGVLAEKHQRLTHRTYYRVNVERLGELLAAAGGAIVDQQAHAQGGVSQGPGGDSGDQLGGDEGAGALSASGGAVKADARPDANENNSRSFAIRELRKAHFANCGKRISLIGETTYTENTPPNPLTGAEGASDPQGSRPLPLETFEVFLARKKAAGERAVPADHPVFGYARTVGLDAGMVTLAWWWFKRVHLGQARKRDRDWAARFARKVETNAYRLWLMDANGARLSTAGEQAQRAMAAEAEAAA